MQGDRPFHFSEVDACYPAMKLSSFSRIVLVAAVVLLAILPFANAKVVGPLRPYGPLSFVPPHQVPDLTTPDPVKPVSFQAFQLAQKRCTKQIFQAKRLINSVVPPNPAIWFNNGDTSNNTLAKSLFSSRVNSRISPLGIFPGFELTTQYYYAIPMYFYIVKSAYIEHMLCVDDMVSFRATLGLNTGLNASHWYHLQFDDQGKIKVLDALLYNLGAMSDQYTYTPTIIYPNVNTNTSLGAISSVAINGTNVTYPGGTYTYNLQQVQMICQVSSLGYSPLSRNPTVVPGGTCQGPNAQWNNTNGLSQYDYCMNYLLTEIPYGSWNWANRNNIVCRLIHIQLTYFDPVVHCPHVGSGGMFCNDMPYGSYFPPGLPPTFPVGNPLENTNY